MQLDSSSFGLPTILPVPVTTHGSTETHAAWLHGRAVLHTAVLHTVQLVPIITRMHQVWEML